MSTTARKLAKRTRRASGFTTPRPLKAEKTPTPLVRRSFVVGDVVRRGGDAMPAGYRFSLIAPRSPRRIAKFLQNGGIPK